MDNRRMFGWQMVAGCLILTIFGVPLYIIMWQHWVLVSTGLLIFGGLVMLYIVGLMALHLRARYLSIRVYRPLPEPKTTPKIDKYIPQYVDDTVDEWEGWDEPD